MIWKLVNEQGEEVANYVDQLQAKVAELEAENARLKAAVEYAETIRVENIAYFEKQLATSQLRETQLRKALDAVIKVHGYESGIPVEAISTQASTEALDKYVAEKVKEAGKFDVWKTNPYTKVLETSIEQLTKQRDLAVEAMREALECGEDGDWQSARRILASAIKESEAK